MTTRGPMLTGVLRAAEQGSTVVTANNRTARTLLELYDSKERAAGKHAWPTPDVVAWPTFVGRIWNEMVFTGVVSGQITLNVAQERTIWERSWSEEAPDLLDIAGTAAASRNAWSLVCSYGLPLDAKLFSERPETKAFLNCAQQFQKTCAEHGWKDEASLADAVTTAVKAGRAGARKQILLVGFDRITPQQKALLDALEAGGSHCEEVYVLREAAATLHCVAARDAEEEIEAAAAWVRHKLEAHPETRLAVVSMALEEQRSKIERIFLETLHPDQLAAGTSDGPRAFEVSAGKPLAQHPVIATALLVIKLCGEGLDLTEVSALLHSPFLRSAQTEATARAWLDRELHNGRKLDYTLSQLREAAWVARVCPALTESLKQMGARWREIAETRSARGWSNAIATLLESMGWPGDERKLNGDEYQAVQKWNETVAQFGSLEAVEGNVDAKRMLPALEQCTAETVFEAEKVGAPVQIMGALEAAGSAFDGLWVMGLHDGAWPASSRPNSFLPFALQSKYEMPGASAAAELRFAKAICERMIHSADEVIFSWPRNDGESVLRVSPVIGGLKQEDSVWTVAGKKASTWGQTLVGSFEGECIVDERAPELVEGTPVAGGTKVLRSEALCPFLAYAGIRLGAEEQETPEPGLDVRLRGIVVHRSLEYVWKELKSHAELVGRWDELQGLVERCVEQAIESTALADAMGWEKRLLDLEKMRVTALVVQLLKIERDRVPFTVESEKARNVEIGGIKLRMQVDRIDRLTDGSGCVLIDYKTGEASEKSWDGNRPEEPQIPAYAATMDDKLAAVAFAKVKAGNVGFDGYSPNPAVLPGVTEWSKTGPGAAGLSLPEVVERWKEAVEQLAVDFRRGRAEANPLRKDTCKNCDLPAVCRIAEQGAQAEEEANDAE